MFLFAQPHTDLVKIALLFTWLGVNDVSFFKPLHISIGAFLIPDIIPIFFQDHKKAILPLGIGIITHFILISSSSTCNQL